MCMCHYCSIIGLFIGEILYAVQKLIQCAAIGSVFTCLMFSFTVMLMMGVGLGYNQCKVEKPKVVTTTQAPWTTTARGWFWWMWPGNWFRAGDNSTDFYDPYMATTSVPGYQIDPEETDTDYDFDEIRPKRSENKGTPDNSTYEHTFLPPTMILPIKSHRMNNILKLIRRIRRRGKNLTLEFIET